MGKSVSKIEMAMLLVCFGVFTAYGQDELCLNGDFEKVVDFKDRCVSYDNFTNSGGKFLGDILPDKWLFEVHGGQHPAMGLDEGVKYSGEFSVKIVNGSDDNIGVLRNEGFIPVKTDTTYVLTFYVKGEDITGKGGACAFVSFASKSGGFWSDPKRGTIWSENVLNGTFDWTKQELKFTTDNTAEILLLGLQLRNASGTVWFDDVSLVEFFGG